MVGIQVGNEQEERKGEEEDRLECIVIFVITGNADEGLRGRGIQARKIFELDCASPSSLERRERERYRISRGRGWCERLKMGKVNGGQN